VTWSLGDAGSGCGAGAGGLEEPPVNALETGRRAGAQAGFGLRLGFQLHWTTATIYVTVHGPAKKQ
jgi:hypothetical protein